MKSEFLDLKIRTSIYIKVALITALFAVISLLSLFLINKYQEKHFDYQKETITSLNLIYNEQRSTELKITLQKIKNDNNKIITLKDIIQNQINTWYEETLKNEENYQEKISRLTQTIKILRTIKINKQEILEDEYYDKITSKIENNNKDYETYTKALNYYYEKEYNESYGLFNTLNRKSNYYNKSKMYKDEIAFNVLDTLENEINIIESSKDKNKDIQITNIINEYKQKYNKLELEKNYYYIDLVNAYTKNSKKVK